MRPDRGPGRLVTLINEADRPEPGDGQGGMEEHLISDTNFQFPRLFREISFHLCKVSTLQLSAEGVPVGLSIM